MGIERRGGDVNVNFIGQVLAPLDGNATERSMARGPGSSLTEQRVGSILQNPHRKWDFLHAEFQRGDSEAANG